MADSIEGESLAETAAVEVMGVGAAAAVGEVFGTADLGFQVFDQMVGSMIHADAEERGESGSERIGSEAVVKVADFVAAEGEH